MTDIRTILLLAAVLAAGVPSLAQNQAYSPNTEPELADPHPSGAESWQNEKAVRAGWGTIDERYKKDEAPSSLAKTLKLYGWRGERVQAQAVVVAPKAIGSLKVSAGLLAKGKKSIPETAVNEYFVKYVLADSYLNIDGNHTSYRQDKTQFDSILVADRLQPAEEMQVEACTVRPIWLDIKIPSDAEPGRYSGTLNIEADGTTMTLAYSLEVSERVLPEPEQWGFHLDLWQNPYAVARYYGVPLWSEEHFDAMRPIMTEYARLGGKVITTTIIRHAWNGQTEDPFESMVGKKRKIDGSWEYDYTVFDRWVSFMMDCGVTKQIDCYALLPWHLRYDFYDEATNSSKEISMKPEDKEFEEYFVPFLKDFAAHLKSKGWFERTCLAMDERPMNMLVAANSVVAKADAGFKFKGAFNYFPTEVDNLHDVSVIYDHIMDREDMDARVAEGKQVTVYTCCVPDRPNTFLCSEPAEAAYIGWHAMACGFSGYLRWAYNSWVKSPNQDSRFRTWIAGDCYLTYPDGSSIRLMRLLQGIQDYEKIRILKQELSGKKLEALENELEKFTPAVYPESTDPAALVNEAETLLRSLE